MLNSTRNREQAVVTTGVVGEGDEKELSPSLRKIVQTKANKALAERTKSALAVMPIFIIFVLLTPCFSDLPKMVITIGTVLFTTIILRVLVAKQARIDEVAASASWLRNYVVTTLLMSSCWSLFLITVFYHYKTDWVFLLLLLSTAGIASAAASSLAPNARLARTYIIVLIAPVMTMGFIHQTRPSVTFGVLMTIFIISLLIMIKDNNHQLLSHFSTIERLNVQKADLETLILNIRGNSDALKHSSVNLSGISGSMSEQAVAMSTDLQDVAASAETFHASSKNVAASMQTVMDQADQAASSIETMTIAIDAIARSTQGTKTIADEAVKQAGSATGKVSELGQSAKQVGNISETIKKISEQTNLLALNATIEAARAGDAGKGFAVVANEIKELANQTAKATLEIKNQIDGIQKAVSETMAEIGQISSITSQINTSINDAADSVNVQLDTAKTIAAAVQETSRVLTHLSREIAGNSETAGAIAAGITNVSKAADEVAAASAKVDQGTGALMDLADTLNQTVQIRH